jgi:phospholipase/carboxylesterase
MTARELIPFEEAGTTPLTVIALHATGADETQLVPLARDLVPGAAVLAPRGTVMEDGHTRRFFRRRGMTDLDIPDLQERADELAGAISERLSALGRPTDGTIALGYSNGANIALGMMFRHPGLFAGAILLRPMLPYVPEPAPGLSGARVLVAAGAADPFCPPEMTEALVRLLEGCGAEVTLALRQAGHEVTPDDLDEARRWLAAFTPGGSPG